VYSRLVINLLVTRKAGFWMYNVLLPLFIIASCMLASYALDPRDLPNRMAIVLTVMLAMVAFKYAITERLPAISYATLIDLYVLFCFIFAFFVVLHQTGSKAGLTGEEVIYTRTNTSSLDNLATGTYKGDFYGYSSALPWGVGVWLGSHAVLTLCVGTLLYFQADKAHADRLLRSAGEVVTNKTEKLESIVTGRRKLERKASGLGSFSKLMGSFSKKGSFSRRDTRTDPAAPPAASTAGSRSPTRFFEGAPAVGEGAGAPTAGAELLTLAPAPPPQQTCGVHKRLSHARPEGSLDA